MQSDKNEKFEHCITDVSVTRTLLDTPSYRLFLMLNPVDKSWKNTGEQKMYEVKFVGDEETSVQHIGIVSEL